MGSKPATVLVTDADRGSALSFIRSLGRAGYRVIATSAEANAGAFHSRYVHAYATCVGAHDHPALFVDAVLETVERYGVDIVVPITETSVIPLSAQRDRFTDHCKLAIVEPAALAIALDKRRTFEVARELGVPAPESHFVATSADFEAVQSGLSWPVVVKPQFSLARRDEGLDLEECKISYANSADDVLARIRQADSRYGFLLQDYRGGRGVGVEMLVWDGAVQAAFQHVRLAEVPITGGASALRESAPVDPLLLEYGARIVARLSWTGLCMIEFRGEGAEARLMEMNGRVWGSLPLAVQSGMDFPVRLIRLMLGEDQPVSTNEAITRYRVGHRAYNADLLAVWFGSVLRGSDAPVPMPSRQDALRVLRMLPRAQNDISDTTDPGPAMGAARRIVRKVISKLAGAVRGLG